MLRNLLTTLLLCALFAGPLCAQKSFYHQPYSKRNSGSYDRNTSIFSVGLGVPYYHGGGYYYGNYYANDWGGAPSLYLKYEHALLPEVGIGGNLAFAFDRNRYHIGNTDYVDHRTTVGLSVLGFYHFNKLIPVRKLDVYAGVGFTIRNYFWNYDYQNGTHADISVHPTFRAGARYYFTRRFGAYADVGYDGISPANFGVSWRF